jgi:hypothetical protein
MEVFKHRKHYHEENESEHEADSRMVKSMNDNDKRNERIFDSTTVSTVKNKKHVHYPHTNGEHARSDQMKTDGHRSNNDSSLSGKQSNDSMRYIDEQLTALVRRKRY